MNDLRVPVWTRVLTEEDHICADDECESRPLARVGEWPYCREHFVSAVTARLMVSKVFGYLRCEDPKYLRGEDPKGVDA